MSGRFRAAHLMDAAVKRSRSIQFFERDNSREELGMLRDPEDRPTKTEQELREKMFDKTLADSFPTSDPPSTIPNPSEDDSLQESDHNNPKGSSDMADDKTPRGMNQDRKLISLKQDYEVRYWTEALGVSRERLEELVNTHGHSAEKVREALRKEAA